MKRNFMEVLSKRLNKSKKGFTLIELVVVIAILAILAVIAVPTIAGTIDSAKFDQAVENSHTIEYSIKEAQALIKANDPSVYDLSKTVTLDIVANKKSLTNAFSEIKYKNKSYYPVWSEEEHKVYYADGTDAIDGTTLVTTVALTDANGNILKTDVETFK